MAIPEQVQVRLDWSGAEESPTMHVNQVMTQVGPPSSAGVPDGIYLSLGSISPPLIPPDEEGRAQRVADLARSSLKVSVHARAHVSREALADIIRALQTAADQYDALAASAAERKAQERV